MLRKILLRKAKHTWRIENEAGYVISERRCKHRFDAVHWCDVFLSSFNEVFKVEVIDDERQTISEKDESVQRASE